MIDMPTGSGGTGGSAGASPSGGGGGPDEWTAIRSVLSGYDTNLHDLRKTGLAVITALLTATAVSTLFNLPNYEVFTLILLTYVLIFIMQYLDQHYRTFQRAAMARARVIEPVLNVELSQKIATVYKKTHGYLINPVLYIALIVIACGLGCASISAVPPANNATNVTTNNATLLFTNNSAVVSSDNATTLSTTVSVNISPATSPASPPPVNTALASLRDWYIGFLIVWAVVITVWMIYISRAIKLNLKRGGTGLEDDWIVDRITCVKGDVVKITVTNLGEIGTATGETVTVIDPGEKAWIPGLGEIAVTRQENGEMVVTLGDMAKVTSSGNKVTITPKNAKEMVIENGWMIPCRKVPVHLGCTKVSIPEQNWKLIIPVLGNKVTISDQGTKERVINPGEKPPSPAPGEPTITNTDELVTVTNQNNNAVVIEKGRKILCKKVRIPVLDKKVSIPLHGGKITVTIQGENVMVTEKGDTGGISFENEVCGILDEKDRIVHIIKVDKKVLIPVYENHSWLWDTAPAHIGANATYRIMPIRWTYPLAQITVLDKVTDDNRPKPRKVDYESWTVDKTSCEKGDVVTITVTNVSYPGDKKVLTFENGETVCQILNDSNEPVKDHPIKANMKIEIRQGESCSWVWDTTPDLFRENILYRLIPGTPKITPIDPKMQSKDQTTPQAERENLLKQSVTILKRDTRSILKGL